MLPPLISTVAPQHRVILTVEENRHSFRNGVWEAPTTLPLSLSIRCSDPMFKLDLGGSLLLPGSLPGFFSWVWTIKTRLVQNHNSEWVYTSSHGEMPLSRVAFSIKLKRPVVCISTSGKHSTYQPNMEGTLFGAPLGLGALGWERTTQAACPYLRSDVVGSPTESICLRVP